MGGGEAVLGGVTSRGREVVMGGGEGAAGSRERRGCCPGVTYGLVLLYKNFNIKIKILRYYNTMY